MPCLFRAIYASVTSFFFKGLSCLQQEGPGIADAKSVNQCPKRTDLSNQMSMFRYPLFRKMEPFESQHARLILSKPHFFSKRWPAVIKHYYLITLSAWTSTCCGTTRPSCCAVFRLMKISNLAGSFTGKSPGLVPFRISTTYSAARRYKSDAFAP